MTNLPPYTEEELIRRSTEWSVNVDKVRQAFNELINIRFSVNTLHVHFLLAKDVPNEYIVVNDVDTSQFTCILQPPNDYWQRCRDRIDQLLQPGDITSNQLPTEIHTFEQFLQSIPAWKTVSPDVFVFPRENQIIIKHRTQQSGLCFINAPLVIQYYLVALQKEDRNAGMIDMTKMIRTSWTSHKLQKYILEDSGGESTDILRSILEQGKNSIVPVGYFGIQPNFIQYMNHYGPVLVSGFTVHDDLCETNKFSYDGHPAGAYKGRHAMVIIGYRKVEHGNLWFLVQSWWPFKQFIEISQKYMINCQASMYVVENPQNEIPTQFPVHNHLYAGSSIDKPEELNCEDPVYPVLLGNKYVFL
jgi:hypothetical protein